MTSLSAAVSLILVVMWVKTCLDPSRAKAGGTHPPRKCLREKALRGMFTLLVCLEPTDLPCIQLGDWIKAVLHGFFKNAKYECSFYFLECSFYQKESSLSKIHSSFFLFYDLFLNYECSFLQIESSYFNFVHSIYIYEFLFLGFDCSF